MARIIPFNKDHVLNGQDTIRDRTGKKANTAWPSSQDEFENLMKEVFAFSDPTEIEENIKIIQSREKRKKAIFSFFTRIAQAAVLVGLIILPILLSEDTQNFIVGHAIEIKPGNSGCQPALEFKFYGEQGIIGSKNNQTLDFSPDISDTTTKEKDVISASREALTQLDSTLKYCDNRSFPVELRKNEDTISFLPNSFKYLKNLSHLRLGNNLLVIDTDQFEGKKPFAPEVAQKASIDRLSENRNWLKSTTSEIENARNRSITYHSMGSWHDKVSRSYDWPITEKQRAYFHRFDSLYYTYDNVTKFIEPNLSSQWHPYSPDAKYLLTSDACYSGMSVPMKDGCLNGDCYNGYGTYQYTNGDKYIGDFCQGKPNGKGILYFANGNKYLGAWEEGHRQGDGKLILDKGHIYKGQFKRDQFYGKGEMDYANGDRYIGDFQNSKPNGNGTYYFKTDNRYEGQFQEGKFNGKGTMIYKDGSKFTGFWRDNRKNGSGTFYDMIGKAYVSNWSNGQLLLGIGSIENDGETVVVDIDENDTFTNTAPHPAQTTSHPASRTPESSVRIFAVVVGIAQYTHMQALSYTDDDAYQIYAFLKSPQGGALPDNQVQILVDENATHDNILNAMKKTFFQADTNDVVLFYFSGHGTNGAFMPVDFDGNHNYLLHQEIEDVLDRSPAKHKIVFGDACHSGFIPGYGVQGDLFAAREPMKDMAERYYKAFERSRGSTALLLSSKDEEVSLEDAGLRSGVFSHFIIEGLKGKADTNSNGIITINELYNYVTKSVTKYTAGAQTPILLNNFDKDVPVGFK